MLDLVAKFVPLNLAIPIVLALGMASSGSQTPGLDLPIAWKRPVGWISLASVSYNLATCPDGSVYIISTSGSVKAVTSEGGMSVYAPIDVDRHRAISCDAERRLYVAGRELEVFEPAGGKLALISSRPLHVALSKILVAPSSGYVFGIQDSAQSSKLYLLSPTLRVLSTFDRERFALPGTAIPLQGTLSWDKSGNRVMCVLSGDNRLQFFSDRGSRIGSGRHAEPLVGPHSLLGGEDLVNITSTADGGFVAEVFVGGDRLSPATLAVKIMDSSLKVTSPAIRAAPFGFLVGSAPDGGLYFVAPTGINQSNLIESDLVKRVLVK